MLGQAEKGPGNNSLEWPFLHDRLGRLKQDRAVKKQKGEEEMKCHFFQLREWFKKIPGILYSILRICSSIVS